MRRYNPLVRLYRGTGYSLSGLLCALKEEQAFQLETVVLAVLVGVLLWARPPLSTSVAVLAGWLTVMAFELVNSAVERAFDLIDKERNPQIKAGKDMLSAAVFLSILCNLFLWGMLLYASLAI
ncbi:MAG: diacylglycerol kinase [Synergistaceae bacterium]|jgi:diacylglycerol kinase (ATP)|nr:diacylglycerol kinase [Synergistaceae bacterium]